MKPTISMMTLKFVEAAEDKGVDDSDAGGVEHRINEIIESQWNQ
jgi:hypothetical protein